MNFKKILFLFLALLLPAAVFIFLKLFGKNEFAVPPLFQDVVEVHAGCESFAYHTPYVIHDSVLSTLSWSRNDSITLVVFEDALEENKKKISTQVNRIFTEFPTEKVHFFSHFEEFSTEKELPHSRVSILKINNNQFSTFKNCIFLLKPSDNVVMIDSKRRIKGQYNLLDLEDADRLMTEMKIILKKY